MKQLKIKSILRYMSLFILLMAITTLPLSAGQNSSTDIIQEVKKNYLATSVFILSSLIPDDDTYFYELDYGRKLSNSMDVVVGMNIYKYAAPMSSPINDITTYPGTVTSYGAVFAFQYYYWKDFFIDQMINPLILDYNHAENGLNHEGFMLLLATRLGYHHDFSMFKNPFFIEFGAEVSYWPINSNVPSDFRAIDVLYKSYVFSPALQFGFRF